MTMNSQPYTLGGFAARLDAVGYIVKPFKAEEILESVKRHIA